MTGALTWRTALPIALVACFGIALVLPIWWGRVLRRMEAVDVPNHRSSHSAETLRGFGFAQVIAVIVGCLVIVVLAPWNTDSVTLVIIIGSGVTASVIGLADDLSKSGLGALLRLPLQTIVGVATALTLRTLFGVPWWAAALAAFGFVAYLNSANFMDGIDGISSLHGLVAGSAYSVIGLVGRLPWLVAAGALVAAAFIAFLPWNLRGSKAFLGDVGSYLLGGTLAALAIAAAFSGVSIVVALAPISIYLADTGFTLLRRAIQGEPVLSAHRTHVYQRLACDGRTHVPIALAVAGFTIIESVIGILLDAGKLQIGVATGLLVTVIAAYLALPRLSRRNVSTPSCGEEGGSEGATDSLRQS
jgi:UDP-N-acetylmuramyl pentapeptide phosphotransferase/UDP-N-acetylglucosamine-1-phosphate transferase